MERSSSGLNSRSAATIKQRKQLTVNCSTPLSNSSYEAEYWTKPLMQSETKCTRERLEERNLERIEPLLYEL